ncbi:MAG: RNA-guided pseudouridylation complex pseudouridine synthase subunit Cbf5 [Candidatus Helarchaeota archaeon]|nr:RNA-guided pseudouridylation complex pseudouridine synthase subunit Cbf5 [Candidatus Helarchaeota archaeon]
MNSYLKKSKEPTTNLKYGSFPEKREINEYIKKGFIVLDKPSGPSSHEVAAWVKNILNLSKTGHCGTLDPKVTGILPMALEYSTKIIQIFLKSNKEYIGIMKIHKPVTHDKIRKVCKEFLGPIYQRPPLRSSVRRNLRVRHIYYLNVLEFENSKVLFRIGCEAGTYIRKICFDIGEILGVGAHMQELRRTRHGNLKEDENLITLHDLTDAYHFWKEDNDESYLRKIIFPMEKMIDFLPKIIIRDSAIDAICHGADLAAPGIVKLNPLIKPNSLVGIFSLKNELIALGMVKKTSKQILETEHGIVCKTQRVIMEPGVYPAWYEYKKYKSE